MELPPTPSALRMRDTEIAVLDGHIEALNQEKRRSWGGISQKKSTRNFDEEIAELHTKKQPLVTEKEREEEEERKHIVYKNENAQLKKMLKELKSENEEVLSENTRLKRYIKELEKERVVAASEYGELQEKIAEQKQIVQTHLEQKDKDLPENDNEMKDQQGKLKVHS